MSTPNLSIERLRDILHYDSLTGVWTNRVRRGRVLAGSPAGGVEEGYLRIQIAGRKYLAHRLAFFYMTGEWPEQLVDHKNTTPLDNRWDNLRRATPAVNSENVTRARIDNTSSGLQGVSRAKPTHRWAARIRVKGRFLYLGRFDDKHEAHAAYVAAKRRFHEGCTL